MEYATDFDDLQRIGGHLLLSTRTRFGLDTETSYFQEQLPGDRHDHLWLGDCNVVYRFAQSEHAQFRTGIGFNWMDDPADTDFGFNFTYGPTSSPPNPGSSPRPSTGARWKAPSCSAFAARWADPLAWNSIPGTSTSTSTPRRSTPSSAAYGSGSSQSPSGFSTATNTKTNKTKAIPPPMPPITMACSQSASKTFLYAAVKAKRPTRTPAQPIKGVSGRATKVKTAATIR